MLNGALTHVLSEKVSVPSILVSISGSRMVSRRTCRVESEAFGRFLEIRSTEN